MIPSGYDSQLANWKDPPMSWALRRYISVDGRPQNMWHHQFGMGQ